MKRNPNQDPSLVNRLFATGAALALPLGAAACTSDNEPYLSPVETVVEDDIIPEVNNLPQPADLLPDFDDDIDFESYVTSSEREDALKSFAANQTKRLYNLVKDDDRFEITARDYPEENSGRDSILRIEGEINGTRYQLTSFGNSNDVERFISNTEEGSAAFEVETIMMRVLPAGSPRSAHEDAVWIEGFIGTSASTGNYVSSSTVLSEQENGMPGQSHIAVYDNGAVETLSNYSGTKGGGGGPNPNALRAQQIDAINTGVIMGIINTLEDGSGINFAELTGVTAREYEDYIEERYQGIQPETGPQTETTVKRIDTGPNEGLVENYDEPGRGGDPDEDGSVTTSTAIKTYGSASEKQEVIPNTK